MVSAHLCSSPLPTSPFLLSLVCYAREINGMPLKALVTFGALEKFQCRRNGITHLPVPIALPPSAFSKASLVACRHSWTPFSMCSWLTGASREGCDPVWVLQGLYEHQLGGRDGERDGWPGLPCSSRWGMRVLVTQGSGRLVGAEGADPGGVQAVGRTGLCHGCFSWHPVNSK